MSPTKSNNSQLPESSSSISLNESPNEEINYDSDISEDDHAIAEGGDDDEYDDEEEDDGDAEDEGEESDEGFAVEVNTLTGSTFNIMIHPSDTVEVLKTRIAFQEGISPADQNLLLDSTTGCNNSATVQELNIDRNSKLTLVTNVSSGVPFKTTTPSLAAISDGANGEFMGGAGVGDHHQSSSPSYKLAPTIKRNYHNNSNSNNNHCSSSNNQQKHSSSSSSSSLRLPKILTTNAYLDKNSNIIGSSSSSSGGGGAMHKNDHAETSQQRQKLDEREWMKSLFNKVVHQNGEDTAERNVDAKDCDFCNSPTKIVIDIDSTNAKKSSTTTALLPPHFTAAAVGASLSTRYVGTKYAPEEDGSILVVQGDDGVILIIQKNTGQLLEESFEGDSNNKNNKIGNNRFNSHKSNHQFVGDEMDDGRVGRLGKYTKENSVNSSMSSSNYRRGRYQQDNKLVHEKIKENAVTLEKMRQVRSLMAQQKKDRSGNRAEGEGAGQEERGNGAPAKTLEFPRISGGVGGSKPLGIRNAGAVGYKSNGGVVVGVGGRRSATGGGGRASRSINSSKMSLNRLIAEIYLQTKRKDRQSFQPGQPPYTNQQLLRYVQLKTAILLDEQKKNKTEPCSKCQLDEDWSFNEAAPYLVPTVVMNRYKRLANGRNSKSLDKEDNDDDDLLINSAQFRRKSMIPVVASSTKPLHQNAYNSQQTNGGMDNNNDCSDNNNSSYIPRLILVNREREVDLGATRNNPCSVASSTTTASTISRRSSSSLTKDLSGGGGPYQFSSSGSSGGGNNRENPGGKNYYENRRNKDSSILLDEDDDDDDGICDTIIITTTTNNGNRAFGSGGKGGRPTFKVYPKIYYSTSSSNGSGGGRSSSSRPGSTGKASAAKKGSVRCQTCKKKVGIACRYQCRCGLTFCSTHRYPEAHECTFDYKTEGRNKLRENNPVIVAPKIQEI